VVYVAGIEEEFPSSLGCLLPMAFIPRYAVLKVIVASVGTVDDF
jgi:hypothetical protein